MEYVHYQPPLFVTLLIPLTLARSLTFLPHQQPVPLVRRQPARLPARPPSLLI